MGRDRHDFQLIDPAEFLRFGDCRTGHAGQLLIHAEIVLQGDGGVGYVLGLDLHALFRFHGLVQAIAPAAAGHQASGELVHDHHLARLDQVILVALEDILGAHRLLEIASQASLFRGYILRPVGIHQRLAQQLLCMCQAHFGERNVAVLFVHLIILRTQLLHNLRHFAVPFQVA